MKWNLKKLQVNELKEWEKNPRLITDKGINDLKKSIDKFGVAEPIVINADNTICGGHGRLKVLKELGIKEVDCYIPEKKLTDKQFEELNIRLNKNIAGDWDFETLSDEFETEDLLEWGFDDIDLYEEPIEPPQKDKSGKPFEKTHFLISFPPKLFPEVKDMLENIISVPGVEYEQGSN
jgi:ParB family chromosome partitioning protein